MRFTKNEGRRDPRLPPFDVYISKSLQDFIFIEIIRLKHRAVLHKERRARRTLFAPRFRSRSIVTPAHKPATIFSDQSPRDEHERLREVRVRPGGNGATKKPQHSLRLFLVHHRGLSRALKTPHWGVFARRTGGGPELFSSPDGAPD